MLTREVRYGKFDLTVTYTYRVQPLATASSQTSETLNRNRRLFLLAVVTALVLSCLAMYILNRSSSRTSLFDLGNLVGPTTQSLLHGGGLTVCTEQMGTPSNPICFHAGRMPMASVVVAAGIAIFGDRYVAVDLFKTLLFLIPIVLTLWLVWQRFPSTPVRRIATLLLVLAPFGMTAFLADVVNLQVEEGYSYSLLALAFALLLFPKPHRPGSDWQRAILFALSVDGLYLAKSSMVVVVAVLAVSYFFIERKTALRLFVLAMIVAAPVGWALHQHHASGRYSLGTSIDGINLHKANNPDFLSRYPPPPGGTIDMFDSDLNRGHYFPDEWSYNDYHQEAATAFIKSHPQTTAHSDLRKLNIIFFSIRKSGSAENKGVMRWIEEGGFLVFRLILWVAIFASLSILLRRKTAPDSGVTGSNPVSLRWAALIFLGIVAATAFPYVVGFAYTRHVSVLIYPASLFCCRWLQDQCAASDRT